MPRPQRLAARIAYLGTPFAGWQRQNNARTVQGEVEAALERVYGRAVTVTGAGRTDAGVHADGQVAHWDAPTAIPAHGVQAALNAHLPDEIRVLAVRGVPPGFHATRSALTKRYRYRVAWGATLLPHEAQRRVWIPWKPGLEPMVRCAALIVGTHDFAAFALSGHAGTGARGTVRTVTTCRLAGRGRRLDLVIEGDGFLRGMVRRLAGALLEVGRGARTVEWFAGLVSAAATGPPAPTAPPHGLTLERVRY